VFKAGPLLPAPDRPGKFFTTDKSSAEYYQHAYNANKDARIDYIDVPNNQVEDFRFSDADEFIVDIPEAPPRVDLQQLRDPEFSRKAVDRQENPLANMSNPYEEKLSIEDRYTRWAKDNEPVAESLQKSPRAMAVVKDAFGGDYIKADFIGKSGDPDMPAFFWHMDKTTDLRAPDEGFIQTTPRAREVGLHLGSHQAPRDMFSPTVWERMERDGESIRRMFDELSDKDPQVGYIFEDAWEAIRRNKHIRIGEGWQDSAVQEAEMRQIVKDLFDEIAVAADSYRTGDNMELMNDIASLGNSDMMAGRILRWMNWSYDPTTVPVVVKRPDNPLYVPDLQTNDARAYANYFRVKDEGIFDSNELQAVVDLADRGEDVEANKLFASLLRDKGHDPVLIYHNAAEDKGVLSLVVLDESYILPLWGRGTSLNPDMAARMKMEHLMAPLAAMLGIGGKDAALRDAE
jgi:hypothetical protein